MTPSPTPGQVGESSGSSLPTYGIPSCLDLAQSCGFGAWLYGEWRIQVKPDQGPAYNRLIEQSGLPLFREAGGRMVGWWKTLIGDLYEHVTIWEYDDMAAFERAGQFLSKNAAFAQFVAARDPLLAGEESRSCGWPRRCASCSCPSRPRLSFTRSTACRWRRGGLPRVHDRSRDSSCSRAHGFRPVGPWVVDVGRWSEITYLFRFESLAERERLIAEFSATADARTLRPTGQRVRSRRSRRAS